MKEWSSGRMKQRWSIWMKEIRNEWKERKWEGMNENRKDRRTKKGTDENKGIGNEWRWMEEGNGRRKEKGTDEKDMEKLWPFP